MKKNILKPLCILLCLTLLFPVYAAYSANKGRAKSKINSIKIALNAFAMDVGRYPSQEEGLDSLIKRPHGLAEWDGPYIKGTTVFPKDPWGGDYVYIYPLHNQENSYGIYSMGKDGITNTKGNDQDDINSWNSASTEKPRTYNSFGIISVIIGCFMVFLFIILLIPKKKRAKKKTASDTASTPPNEG